MNRNNRTLKIKCTDINFIYCLANRKKRRSAVKLNQEMFPTRCQPKNQIIASAHQNIVLRGSIRVTMQSTRYPRIVRIHLREKGLLHSLDQNPENSVMALDTATGMFWSVARHLLQGETIHPFNLQSVQLLLPDDHPLRIPF
ncbi:hypothetical protein NPIL_87521 [Nephila pilipes]|uniref:Uncharacterized protein n=1 Tax=Nephila pilipes TaxID=299642 RepID=A0A8X6P9V5_NEPPI|nr:hypothetical protein NPIL_87521 [Nephila pilipes]